MLGDEVVDSIAVTITTLRKAAENYKTINDDTDLPPAFHAAGQRSGLVRHTLEIVKDQLKGICLAGNIGDAMCSLEECDKKIKILQDMLEHITRQPQTSRQACYLAAVRQQGRETAVEILMVRIMEATLVVAEDRPIKDATEALAKELRGAIDELSAVEPSVPEEGSNQFHHYGSGPQLNNTGSGIQYNNTGAGSQYHAGTMHFGSR